VCAGEVGGALAGVLLGGRTGATRAVAVRGLEGVDGSDLIGTQGSDEGESGSESAGEVEVVAGRGRAFVVAHGISTERAVSGVGRGMRRTPMIRRSHEEGSLSVEMRTS